ncbi:MAG: C1 family peptidase [Chitinophagales bacterium]
MKNFNQYRYLFATILLSFALFSSSCEDDFLNNPDQVDDFLYALGWLEPDENLNTIQSDLYLGSTSGLPSKVDLTTKFPPIGDQESYGTCATWTIAYNLKTAMEGMDKGYSSSQLAQASKQFSPKDLFWAIPNGSKAANCGGATFSGTFDVLQSRGVATMATVPYESLGDCSNSPNSSWTNEASNYKIENYRKIDVDINTLKSYLAQNRPIAIGVHVGDKFLQWNNSGVLSSETYNYAGQHAYHGLILAGYDDNKGANGAFELVNSWSEAWGDNGGIWVDYNYFVSEFCFAAFVAKNKQNGYNPDSNNDNQVDNEDIVANDTDLLAWSLEDFDDPEYDDERVRSIAYSVYNVGSQNIPSSKRWNIIYAYYNAYDANEWDVLLYDYYTDEFGSPNENGPLEGGDGVSGNWWNDVNIAGGSSVSAAFGSDQFYWGYTIPSHLNGNYYMVLIADGYDDIEEKDEENNYFFFTADNNNPLYIENGVIQNQVGKANIPQQHSENIVPPTANAIAPAATTRGSDTPNAYTTNELRQLIKHHKESGQLDAKVKTLLEQTRAKTTTR